MIFSYKHETSSKDLLKSYMNEHMLAIEPKT